MKAEDLMNGDWVMSFGQVTEVWMVDASHENEEDQLINYLDAREFEPIPITPEILEKNGILYEKQSYYYVIKDDEDLECTYYMQQILQEDWAIGVDIGAYDCSVFARIKYVHELQHALKLCGIDKEIVV